MEDSRWKMGGGLGRCRQFLDEFPHRKPETLLRLTLNQFSRCGLEVEQLRAVRRQGEIKSWVLQVCATALILFLAQQVFHGPVTSRKAVAGHRHTALAGVRRQIHHHQIELAGLRLPLHDGEVAGGWIARPCGPRLEYLAFAFAYSRGGQGRQ